MEHSEFDKDESLGGVDRNAGAGQPQGFPKEGGSWLHSIIHNSTEIIQIVDPNGTLRYANAAFERVLGYDPDEAIGEMNVLDHVHPDDLSHVLEETEKALAEAGVARNAAEFRFRHRDGSWRWMESVGTYLLDDPQVRGVVVTSRDVTERKEAQEALKRSEAEVFAILESITDAFFFLDREWRFAYVNRQAQVVLNRRQEELVGERVWEDPTFYPHYRRAVAEGRRVTFEAYYPPLGKWFGVRAYPSESGLSVYFQDVTERRQAEEKLRFQVRLLDAVGEAMIALDMEGRVLYWNRAAEEMYGWSSEEVMGRKLREVVIPKNLQERAEDIAAQLREGRTWTGEFAVQRKDGTTFLVEGTDTPVFGEDGDFVGVVGVLRDITERKEAQKMLRSQ
jgi:PAS domain S-box-containing protein